jgi:hypothetical protein
MKKNTLISIFLLIFTLFQVSAQVQRSNLPTIFITTTNSQPVPDKVNNPLGIYVEGNIVIKSTDPTEELSMITGIRGRGNATSRMDKKSYRIKLDKKTNILNLPAKEKSWVLLANYADKTLIRNAVAFKISQILGFDFTPSVRFVDLVLNGTFLGNYLLTDQIQVSPGRVNIDEQDSSSVTEPNITGGYLLEQAGDPTGEPVWFLSGKAMKLIVKSPDSDIINSNQVNYIKNYIKDFEARLFSADFKDPIKGYRANVDSISLINWYIACELTGNSDSFWSTYLIKKRSDDKLYFGSLWDYDIAFNNDNRLGDATQKLMRENAWDPKAWIQQMWLDEWFRVAVWRRWQQLASNNLLGNINSYINETATLINTSQQLNFGKWNVLNSKVYLETYLFSTYGEGVDYLKIYLANRISFLTTSFSKIEAEKPSEPFVASDNYFIIKNKKTNNLIDVTQNSVNANASLTMWESLENDNGQLWEVKKIDENSHRILNKNSGLAMAGNGFSNNLIQIPVDNSDLAQQWIITPVKTGNIYGIVNKKTGYSINNSNGGFANGTNVIEYTNNISGSENQQWYFQKVELLPAGVSQSTFSIQHIELYPNPANENVSVRIKINETQNLAIKICSLQGIQMYQTSTDVINSGNYVITIPLSGFASGVYFVNITNTQGEKIIRKLIVTH